MGISWPLVLEVLDKNPRAWYVYLVGISGRVRLVPRDRVSLKTQHLLRTVSEIGDSDRFSVRI